MQSSSSISFSDPQRKRKKENGSKKSKKKARSSLVLVPDKRLKNCQLKFIKEPPRTGKIKLVPPLNFCMVTTGIYRSGYPNKNNFSFLKSIGIRTIVCLLPRESEHKEILVQIHDFIRVNKIARVEVPIPSQREPFPSLNFHDLKEIFRLILDIRSHPVLIHCDKGRHRTGVVVGCLRKLQGWISVSIYDEYNRYSKNTPKPVDFRLIAKFELDHDLFDKDYLPDWMKQEE